MNRREAILSTSGMVVSASLGAIACAANNATAQATGAAPKAPGAVDPALADAAWDCVKRGETCVVHCTALLSTGDASMAACAAAAHDMLAAVEALAKIATAGRRHVAAAARLAHDACDDCEAECRKHAHHAVCKDCADACARTKAACKKLLG